MIFPFKPSIFLWFSHDFHYKWAIFHGELLVITRWFPLKGPGGILNGCSSCSKIRRSRDFLVTARIVRAPGPNHLAPGHGWILKKSHKHFTWIAIPDKVNYLSFISIAIFNSYVTNYQRFFWTIFFGWTFWYLTQRHQNCMKVPGSQWTSFLCIVVAGRLPVFWASGIWLLSSSMKANPQNSITKWLRLPSRYAKYTKIHYF